MSVLDKKSKESKENIRLEQQEMHKMKRRECVCYTNTLAPNCDSLPSGNAEE
jgi:hypothetical protein